MDNFNRGPWCIAHVPVTIEVRVGDIDVSGTVRVYRAPIFIEKVKESVLRYRRNGIVPGESAVSRFRNHDVGGENPREFAAESDL